MPDDRREFEDRKVRQAFLRADLDLDSTEDNERAGDILGFAAERMDTAKARALSIRERRAKFVVWLLGSFGVSVIGLATGWLWTWLKL